MVLNPFNIVYDALFSLALTHPYFKTINPGNLIRFDDPTDRNPIKETLATSDLPELMLTIEGSVTNIIDTSDTTKIIRNYAWQMSSGDFRYIESMSEMEWAMMCAMCGWPQKLGNLKWKDRRFVVRVGLLGARTGISDQQANRNIRGWAAVWAAEVEMHFLTRDLLSECQNDSP